MKSPWKHCGVRHAPKRGCICPRCDQYRRKNRIRARDKYDPAKNKAACYRYRDKNRFAILMYWHLLWLSREAA